MKIKFIDTYEYMSGDVFNSGLKVDLRNYKNSNYESRLDFLNELVSQKKIIHLGACDHKPLILEKISQNKWLHKILTDSSTQTLGIDIDEEAVLHVQKLGYNNLLCKNVITEDIPEIINNNWDYMILGEILEHIPNPVSFLSTIHKKYNNYVDKIVITVPNAFSYINIKSILNKTEFINSDHYYWFTPFTLGKILTQSGFSPIYFLNCPYNKTNKITLKNRVLKYFLNQNPLLNESLIMVAEFNKKIS